MNFIIAACALAIILSFVQSTLFQKALNAWKPNIISSLQTSVGKKKRDLSTDPCTRDMNFYLYQRPSINTSVLLNPNNPYQINPEQTIKIFVHGSFSNSMQSLNLQIKTAYLTRYNYNVIMADWSKIAEGFYPTIVEKTPHLGNLLAIFLCNVHRTLNVPLTRVHLIGHSAGAHIAGIAGKVTPEMCAQKIDRITGLDPAGPIFQKLTENYTLRSSDGHFVDIMHTNALINGYYGNLGDVDFHVNCGSHQNGCPLDTSSSSDNNINTILACSHLRALSYWIESISSNNFVAQSCDSCPEVCPGSVNPEYIIMGENSINYSEKKVFWVPTNKTSPYGIGCFPYPSGCTTKSF